MTDAYDISLQQQQELCCVNECWETIISHPDGRRYHNFQEARIKPNTRLVEVFGISNVFTNEHAKDFSKETTRKMRAACKMNTHRDAGDWTDLRECGIKCFDEYLQSVGQSTSLNLSELVQFVTLKVSLLYLFDDAEAACTSKGTFDDIKLIGHRINDLWVESKKPDNERPRWENQYDLHASLRRVTVASPRRIPGAFPVTEGSPIPPITPSENPLNFLLPAYETMWRVVLRCFMEIRLRDGVDKSVWIGVLRTYIDELSNTECMPEAFHRPSETGVRPIDIAKEALRLYPPSRTVHRNFDGILKRANIEACHRTTLLGGVDPLVFRPERWQTICADERHKRYGKPSTKADEDGTAKDERAPRVLKLSEQQLGFMPFANYCTADKSETKAFAMKMVVLLVAILSDGLGDEWRLADGTSLPERGIPLALDRHAYGDLLLTKADD